MPSLYNICGFRFLFISFLLYFCFCYFSFFPPKSNLVVFVMTRNFVPQRFTNDVIMKITYNGNATLGSLFVKGFSIAYLFLILFLLKISIPPMSSYHKQQSSQKQQKICKLKFLTFYARKKTYLHFIASNVKRIFSMLRFAIFIYLLFFFFVGTFNTILLSLNFHISKCS